MIPRGGRLRQRPRVKSGTSTARDRDATDSGSGLVKLAHYPELLAFALRSPAYGHKDTGGHMIGSAKTWTAQTGARYWRSVPFKNAAYIGR